MLPSAGRMSSSLVANRFRRLRALSTAGPGQRRAPLHDALDPPYIARDSQDGTATKSSDR